MQDRPEIILVALYDYHSMAIRGLHAWLESKGHRVKSAYFFSSTYKEGMYTQRDFDAFAGWLAKESPGFIGVSVRSPLFPLFKQLSSAIRSSLPDCKIIAGGPHAIGDPYGCRPYADYVVVGEGEQALLDILGGNCKPGIVYPDIVEDLDSVPFPYYGNDAVFYGKDIPFGKLSYITSRGCFFSCSYCQECVYPVRRRRRSPERSAEDVRRIKQLFPFVGIVTFSDSVFIHDEEWLGRFCDALGNDHGLRFWSSGSAPFITDSMLDLLKRIGFGEIRLGVQSGSSYIRKEIFNRKDDLGKILEVVWSAHGKGIATDCDFIIENPYETRDTMKETRDYIRHLPPSTYVSKFELRYWPGTRLTRRALADGMISPADVSGNFFRFGNWSYTYRRSAA